jgi:DNA-binding CsgD family transcriptional regulator
VQDAADDKAHELRTRFRESERTASRLQLLQAAGAALVDERDTRAALRAVLAQVVRFLAADAGVVMRHAAGGLIVQAAAGATLPVGARIPAAGVFGTALKAPLQIRERVVSPLRVGQSASVVWEVLVALRSRGETRGLLVLSSARPVASPNAADLAALQSVGILLAYVLDERSSASVARPQKRETAAIVARLTPREQQVLALLPRGLSNGELAQELGIATGTVKVHVERILHKLGLKDRTQAAVRATEWGFRT